jgi:hypothetical protein
VESLDPGWKEPFLVFASEIRDVALDFYVVLDFVKLA